MKAEIFGGMVCEENEVAEEFAVRTVCHDCAYKAGYVPKDKEVGVWIDTCDACHQKKPCTDLVHDWKYEISKIANQESPNQESPSVMIEDREKMIRKLDSQKMKGFKMPMCYYKVDAKNIYDTGLGDSFVLWACHYNRDTCCDCLWFLGRYKTLKVAKEYGKQFETDYLVITKGDKFICDRDRGKRTTDGWKVPKWEKITEPLSFENFEVCFSANCETDIHKMNVFNKEIVSK